MVSIPDDPKSIANRVLDATLTMPGKFQGTYREFLIRNGSINCNVDMDFPVSRADLQKAGIQLTRFGQDQFVSLADIAQVAEFNYRAARTQAGISANEVGKDILPRSLR